ncbi:MAG: glycosyltransferase [Deltaproteobacteria bacterium]|nr:glycosyltransferase [Candidatus Deferrimicrobium borealis]
MTVVFNGEEHIEQAILSVLGQRYQNMEYIVVDGGSTDSTLAILDRYADRIDYWISEPDCGIYDAMNKGIALASGDLVGLLNCDDWYTPEAIEEVVRAFLTQPDREAVVAGKWRVILEDIPMTITISPSLKFHVGMPICHQAMFIPRALYRRFGVYDLRYRIGADLDLTVRFHVNGVKFVLIDAVIVNYRMGGSSAHYFREVGAEHSRILRSNLPWTTYILHRIIRLKFEMLMAVSTMLKKTIGGRATGRLAKVHYELRRSFSRYWR